MSVRQLVFLGVIGILSVIAAVVTGPMVTDALLGRAARSDADDPGHSAGSATAPDAEVAPHPEATP